MSLSWPTAVRAVSGLVLSALVASPALANDDDDRRDFWSINAGIAYAWEDHAFRDFDGNDVATFVSGTWGWGPDVFTDWLGVETELGLTVTDGRWQGADWSLVSGGVYLASHWGSERLYLKFRGGFAANQADVEGFTTSDAGLAAGAGLGFQLLGQPLELHITSVDSSINTITLHWQF